MSDRTPQNQDKYVLRLPDGMRDRIKAAAEANNRSMNAEIVATLEEKYPAPDAGFSMEEMIAHIQKLRELAGNDPQKIAEADALERGAILSLLGALKIDPVEAGFGHLITPPAAPEE